MRPASQRFFSLLALLDVRPSNGRLCMTFSSLSGPMQRTAVHAYMEEIGLDAVLDGVLIMPFLPTYSKTCCSISR
jgi:hypothetical protein